MKKSQSNDFPMFDRDYVQSLERGLAVIKAFGPECIHADAGRSGCENRFDPCGRAPFLLTLAKLGYVGTDKKTFWLRSRVLELGYSYLSSQPWWQVAQPVLKMRPARPRKRAISPS